MYSKFHLKDISFDKFKTYEKAGRDAYEEYKNGVKKDLNKFLKKGLQEIVEENQLINGTGLKNYWFPTKKFDVFLSHSHADEEMAIALAGFLKEELGLTTFIDSCVWGYSDDLLREIDEEYCSQENSKSLFSYEKRNNSTSHVHMMLSIALAEMIDQCEVFFLLNTPQSISLKESIDQEQTCSPWIYNELVMANIIRIRTVESHRRKQDDYKEESVEFVYEVDKLLQDFQPLTEDELLNWADAWKKNKSKQDIYQKSLDYIYGCKSKNVMNGTSIALES